MVAIFTKYIPCTERRGSRIKAYTQGDAQWRGHSVTISYDHELNHEGVHRKAARALCDKLNWHGTLAEGGTQEGYVYVFVGAGKPLTVLPDSNCFNV